MNAKSFLGSFGYIANAPDGVKRLREMVLSLGTSGQLGTNIPAEESSDSMLSLIQIEYEQRLRNKQFRKPTSKKKTFAKNSLPPLPKNWCWCELEQVFYPISVPNSKKLPSKQIEPSGAHPVVDQSLDFISGFSSRQEKLVEIPGPVVVFGDHTRILKFIDFDFIPGGDGIKILRPIQVFPNYFFLVLQSFDLSKRGYARVAKVDELIALCDKLEAQQQERERRFPVLSHAYLARFVESPTPASLKAVFKETESVSPDDLRRSILSLAVRGKLVSQDPTDQSAGDLLELCLAERRKLKRAKANQVPAIDHSGALGFDIPASWMWQPLNDLLVFGPTNGISPKAVEHETPVRSLTLTATTSGKFNGDHSKFITTEVSPDSHLWLRDGDMLVQRGNTLEYVGVAAVYRGEPHSFVYPDLMMKLRVCSLLDVDFIHLAMSQETAREFLRRRATGTSGSMPKINQATLKSLPIPVPPLEEQRRIVAKVDQLMTLVDQLEEQQRHKDKVAEAFAQATVRAITGTELREQKGKMKVPETELVSRLQTNSKPKATDQAPLADLLAKHKGELAAKALWQQSGLEIDAFYQQLKTEMAQGWIVEPEKARMTEIEAD